MRLCNLGLGKVDIELIIRYNYTSFNLATISGSTLTRASVQRSKENVMIVQGLVRRDGKNWEGAGKIPWERKKVLLLGRHLDLLPSL